MLFIIQGPDLQRILVTIYYKLMTWIKGKAEEKLATSCQHKRATSACLYCMVYIYGKAYYWRLVFMLSNGTWALDFFT